MPLEDVGGADSSGGSETGEAPDRVATVRPAAMFWAETSPVTASEKHNVTVSLDLVTFLIRGMRRDDSLWKDVA